MNEMDGWAGRGGLVAWAGGIGIGMGRRRWWQHGLAAVGCWWGPLVGCHPSGPRLGRDWANTAPAIFFLTATNSFYHKRPWPSARSNPRLAASAASARPAHAHCSRCRPSSRSQASVQRAASREPRPYIPSSPAASRVHLRLPRQPPHPPPPSHPSHRTPHTAPHAPATRTPSLTHAPPATLPSPSPPPLPLSPAPTTTHRNHPSGHHALVDTTQRDTMDFTVRLPCQPCQPPHHPRRLLTEPPDLASPLLRGSRSHLHHLHTSLNLTMQLLQPLRHPAHRRAPLGLRLQRPL
jgi:hypothetical protein